jgi:hypothetical protein
VHAPLLVLLWAFVLENVWFPAQQQEYGAARRRPGGPRRRRRSRAAGHVGRAAADRPGGFVTGAVLAALWVGTVLLVRSPPSVR